MRRPTVLRFFSVLIAFVLSAGGLVVLATPASAIPAESVDLSGAWVGTVSFPGRENLPMAVTISSNNPLRAEQKTEVDSLCTSIWIEKSRNPDGTITVSDEVQGGFSCGAHTADWVITVVARDRITGFSPTAPSTTFDIARDLTCAKRVARIGEGFPPGFEAFAGALLQRVYGLPEWIGTTVLSASCIGQALEQPGPNGEAPDLWKNINSPAFVDAVCLTAEGLFDPLNLGITRNFFCGASAG